MNSKIAFLLGMTVGTALGVGASWRLLKSHYKKIAEEEIESVKEWFYNKENSEKTSEAETEQEETKEEKERLKVEYNNIVKKYDKTGVVTETVQSTHPYTISPDEYGEKDDYETVTLSYYADGVLADYTTDEIIEDVGALVGSDSLTKFGEYEPNAVFVRNDANRTDYEILLDTSRYTEIHRDVHAGNSIED